MTTASAPAGAGTSRPARRLCCRTATRGHRSTARGLPAGGGAGLAPMSASTSRGPALWWLTPTATTPLTRSWSFGPSRRRPPGSRPARAGIGTSRLPMAPAAGTSARGIRRRSTSSPRGMSWRHRRVTARASPIGMATSGHRRHYRGRRPITWLPGRRHPPLPAGVTTSRHMRGRTSRPAPPHLPSRCGGVNAGASVLTGATTDRGRCISWPANWSRAG